VDIQNLRREALRSGSKALHDAAMSPDSLTFGPLSDKPFAEFSTSGTIQVTKRHRTNFSSLPKKVAL